MSEATKLLQLRQQIDQIDSQLLNLLNQRAKLALQVAEVKQEADPHNTNFYRPEREAQVLKNIQDQNPGPIAKDDIARLFREIMSVCLALEQPLKVAYLGPEGTFSHAAAMKQFGGSAQMHPEPTIDDVFKAVEKGKCQYGLVPVENSSEGVVNITQDAMINSKLRVCAEVNLRIEHHLLSHAKRLDAVKVVAAHPQALRQCRQWLQLNMPWAELKEMDSNAQGAQMAEQHHHWAAIASEQAAFIYRLPKLAINIEDMSDNTTRFWVIGEHITQPSGQDKTAIFFALKDNVPGGLFGVLQILAERKLNMSRIVSRPSPFAKWNYVFFVDIEGHAEDEVVWEACKLIEKKTSHFKLLGAFPLSPLDDR